jgi:hypothetical protein
VENNNSFFNLSTDAGSNYNVTKTTTCFQAFHKEDGTDTILNYDTGRDLAQSTDFQNLSSQIGGSNDDNVCGTLTLFNPASTTYVKHFIATASESYFVTGVDEYAINRFTAGYANTTSAVNAIQFKFGSGNIDDGTILMFGIK